MDKEKKERLWPGDIGYPGGESRATILVDGKPKEAKVCKDSNGNVTSIVISPKIFGIF